MRTYQATEEIKAIFTEGLAAEGCRDRAIKLVFATRRAIRFGVIAANCFAKAWALVHDLHPETSSGPWHYNYASGEIREGTGRDS